MKKKLWKPVAILISAVFILSLIGCESTPSNDVDAIKYVTYEDDNLSYEVPSTWSVDEENSNPDAMITLFSVTDSTSDTPSNVVVQINSKGSNVPDDVDFANEDIMQSFLDFVGNSVKMTDPKISGYEVGDLYVYKIEYAAQNGVKQTAYYPQKFDYTVSIYATDYEEGTEPTVTDVAEKIIETMKIKK